MRIAYVAFQGSLHTQRWVGYFARRGHDVAVVTCGVGDLPAVAEYEVIDVGAPRLGKVGYLLRIPAVRRRLRQLDPDLVHAHWATSYGLLALASGRRPLVVTTHGDDVLIAPRNPLLRMVVGRVLRAAVLVTAPSDEMCDGVVRLAGPGVDVEMFQYGVETGRLFAVSDASRSGGAHRRTGVRAVSARPLLRLYRHDVVVDALAILAGEGVDVRCDFYGDGPERRALERQASTRGLAGKVVFHGKVAPAEVEVALAAADVYVSVSESDGASIALLEALALGPVPVLSDIAANRAWVEDGRNGVLSAIDAESLAAAFRRAVTLDADAVRIRNRALVSERADLETNLGAFAERLEELVGAPGAASLTGARG